MNETKKAIEHFHYGITHDIFSEPVTTYARLAVEALREQAERSRANSFSVQTDMFGEYCLVPTGCDKEKHIYKVVTRFRSNSYCEVPLVHDSKPVIHDGVVDVLNVIHCGIDETKVERVALSDVELYGKRLEVEP
jgi:hypothetical protein